MWERLPRPSLFWTWKERGPSYAFISLRAVDRPARCGPPQRLTIRPLASADLLDFRWPRRIHDILFVLGCTSPLLRPLFQLSRVHPRTISTLNGAFLVPNRILSGWNSPPRHLREGDRLVSALSRRACDGQSLSFSPMPRFGGVEVAGNRKEPI